MPNDTTAATIAAPRKTSFRATDAWIPLGLVFLGLIPAIGGALRLASFAPRGPTLSDAARFASHPGVLAAHIVSALLYSLVGAIQFSPALRRVKPALHKAAGRILAPAGIVAALSGVGTMLAYRAAPTAGPPVHAMRVAVAGSMVAFLAAGLVALRRRDFRAHGVWMTRAYALGIAPGTQGLILAPLALVFGVDSELTFTAGMAIGWLVNIVVAEWLIRRRARRLATTRDRGA